MSHLGWYAELSGPINATPSSGSAESNTNTVINVPPTAATVTPAYERKKAAQNVLYDVTCCKCKRLLNLQNIHYTFQCCHCRHKRCNDCTMKKVG